MDYAPIDTIEDAILARLRKLAPMGYFIGLHIRYAAPIMQFQAYPKAWTDHYAERGYALRDPTIAWGFSTTGSIRWSVLPIPDPFGIIAEGARFGLNYGVIVSCGLMSVPVVTSAPVPKSPTWLLARLTASKPALFNPASAISGSAWKESAPW